MVIYPLCVKNKNLFVLGSAHPSRWVFFIRVLDYALYFATYRPAGGGCINTPVGVCRPSRGILWRLAGVGSGEWCSLFLLARIFYDIRCLSPELGVYPF